MKDFCAEVRANLDVGNFVHKATLLMDVIENDLESVVDLMLEELLAGNERVEAITKEAKSALFTHDSGKTTISYLVDTFSEVVLQRY